MYSPLAIANTMIKQKPGAFSPQWLNKAVYITHGWSLAWGGAILSELPELWRYGPVYASLYTQLSKYRSERIVRPVAFEHMLKAPMVPEGDENAQGVITQIVNAYGKYSCEQMSAICHADGSPWQQEAVANGYKVKKGQVIPEWRMELYYLEKLNEKLAQKKQMKAMQS